MVSTWAATKGEGKDDISVDASIGDCPITGRSTYGYVFLLNGSPVLAKSKTQSRVKTSTTAAEYQAAKVAATENISIKAFLHEIGAIPMEGAPTTLWEDNASTVAFIQNNRINRMTKHLVIDSAFVHEQVHLDKFLQVKYVPTFHQAADIYTKSVPRPAFERHLATQNITDA